MIGLDKNELKIFKKLSHNPQSVADLVRKLKLPRMTVYTNLLRLQKSGLAGAVKNESGKRLLWVKQQDSRIEGELSEVGKILLGHAPKEAERVFVLKGKKEIGDMLMELTTRKDGATMYAIQHAHNWWRWVEVMGRDWSNKHNRAVVKHKIVAFTIHSPHAPEKIKKDTGIIENYKGRHGNSHTIPESFLKKDIAFYIFDDTIFLVNLEKIEATLVRDKEMASFLIKLFAFMFEKADGDDFFIKYNR